MQSPTHLKFNNTTQHNTCLAQEAIGYPGCVPVRLRLRCEVRVRVRVGAVRCVLLQHAMQVRVQCSAMRCSELPSHLRSHFLLWE